MNMKNISIILISILIMLFYLNYEIEARRGCCSHHGGVCGCSCCDGTPLSAKCRPYYPQCQKSSPRPGAKTRPIAPPPVSPPKATRSSTTPITIQTSITGVASVIDGDTIDIHGQRIRLHGIDAPESSQMCRDQGGKDYRCGQRASFILADRIGRRPITCDPKDKDRYGRIVAVCHDAGEDLNAWLVAAGWAMAYQQYSKDYVPQENEARLDHRGIWQGEFIPPWEWRAAKRK
ncbi:hypothetical protein LCGC14_1077080 [marine sediment metagenome]|uniref:TNase-like domain-containing protein n=1 Tax=marine sediment metagenome TaxID=412755 RepID=A0A0F9N3W3_9ZZZZ